MNGGRSPRVKCVVVGDGGAGKTCLLSTYARGRFPTDYVPTVFDNYDTTMTIGGVHVQLGLWDTAGQEDYDKLRPLSYPETDVFLVCFSVGNKPSFANVLEKWSPEVRLHQPRVPVILVGTKSDLRTDTEFMQHLQLHGERPISVQQAEEMAAAIRAVAYIECSALVGSNVALVFEEAVKAVLWPQTQSPSRRRKKRSCCLQ